MPQPLHPVPDHVSLVTQPPRPIVALHGFTQTGASWGRALDAIGKLTPITAIAPDLPGHGVAADERPSGLDEAAQMVAQRVPTTPAAWIGYSLGGRILLHLALCAPHLVNALVLVSTTAGLKDPQERAARRTSDESLAIELESVGIPAFVDKWLAQPMFANLPPDDAGRSARVANTEAGLAWSLRTCGTGTQEPLWEQLSAITVPTLIVTGGLDAKFTALGHRLTATIPRAQHRILTTSGHSCHLEDTDGFAAIVAEFFRPVYQNPG